MGRTESVGYEPLMNVPVQNPGCCKPCIVTMHGTLVIGIGVWMVGLGDGNGDGGGAGDGSGVGAAVDPSGLLSDQIAGSRTHQGPPHQSWPLKSTVWVPAGTRVQ